MIVCPECHGLNRPGANECLLCGHDLRPLRVPEGGDKPGLLERLARGFLHPEEPGTATTPAGMQAAVPDAAPAAPAGIPLLDNRYALLHTLPLQSSVYHTVVDLICPICERRLNAATLSAEGDTAGRCDRCATPIGRLLVHETRGPEPGMPSTALARLSRQGTNLAVHHRVFHASERTSTVIDVPVRWQPLSMLAAPAPLERALAWCQDLSAALGSLHTLGVTWGADTFESLENLLLVDDGRAAWLGDLSGCRLLPAGTAKARVQIARDVLFLARALAYSLLRTDLTPASVGSMPDPPRRALWGALRGEYARPEDFLAALARPAAPPAAAQTAPRWLSQSAAVGPVGLDTAPLEDTHATTLKFTVQAAQWSVPAGLYVLLDGADDAARAAARRALAQPILQALANITQQGQIAELNPGTLLVTSARAGWRAMASDDAGLVALLAVGNQAYAVAAGRGCACLWRAGHVDPLICGDAAAPAATALALQPGDHILLYPQRLRAGLDDNAICAILEAAPSLRAACIALARAVPGEHDAGSVLIRFTP